MRRLSRADELATLLQERLSGAATVAELVDGFAAYARDPRTRPSAGYHLIAGSRSVIGYPPTALLRVDGEWKWSNVTWGMEITHSITIDHHPISVAHCVAATMERVLDDHGAPIGEEEIHMPRWSGERFFNAVRATASWPRIANLRPRWALGSESPLETAEERAAYFRLYPAPAPPGVSSLPRLEAAPGHLYVDIRRHRRIAETMVTTSAEATPAEVVAAIDGFIKRAPREGNSYPFPSLALSLGVLWGCAVANAAGWKWRELVLGARRALAIASPDDAIACDVVDMFERQLARVDASSVVLFDMIVSGNLPKAQPGCVVTLD
jgi:hypothetical protein